MTKLLQKAFDEAAKLPEEEQDALANWLLEELKSEQRWDAAFSKSEDRLSELADEALSEHQEGRTKKLHPDKL